jgi:hypothetical protein
MRNLKRRWTEDEDAKLLTLVTGARSHLSIRVALKRSPAAISSRFNILRKCEVRESDLRAYRIGKLPRRSDESPLACLPLGH